MSQLFITMVKSKLTNEKKDDEKENQIDKKSPSIDEKENLIDQDFDEESQLSTTSKFKKFTNLFNLHVLLKLAVVLVWCLFIVYQNVGFYYPPEYIFGDTPIWKSVVFVISLFISTFGVFAGLCAYRLKTKGIFYPFGQAIRSKRAMIISIKISCISLFFGIALNIWLHATFTPMLLILGTILNFAWILDYS